MKNLEDYKKALAEQPNERMQEKLLAEADQHLDYWQMAELLGVRAEAWA